MADATADDTCPLAPADTKAWCIRMIGESGIKSFYQYSIVGKLLIRLLVTTEPVVISVQGPIDVGAVNRQETSTAISHGTETGHNPVARRPKRLRSDTQDSANQQYSAPNPKHSPRGIDSDHSRGQRDQDYEWDDSHGCSGDEDHVKTETTGSRDVEEHQKRGLQDKAGNTSKLYEPTGLANRASKRARPGPGTTEPARSILCTEGKSRGRVLKKVQFDVDNSEPIVPVARANTLDSGASCSRFASTAQLYEDATGQGGEVSMPGNSVRSSL